MIVQHDHEGDMLTVGCLACIARVQHDQERAALTEAPVRRCTWTFRADDKRHTFTMDVKVPTGWEGWQVDDEYAGDTGGPIGTCLYESGDIECDGMWEACNTIRCTIGPVVKQSAFVPDMARLL